MKARPRFATLRDKLVNLYFVMRNFMAVIASVSLLTVHAATLNIDPAQSQITLSGAVGGFKLSEQAPGSLTTSFGGTIDITSAAGQIQIDRALIDPNTNGNWKPGRNNESASPADLAGEAPTLFGTITGALRDLVVGASSSPKSLNANGQFDASSIIFSFPANTSSVLEYDSFLTGKDSKLLAGTGTNQAATVGTLIDNAGAQKLTIPLDAIFYFSLVLENDTELRLRGQLVASTAPASVTPEIQAIQIINGNIEFTVTGASATARLQSSTDLANWTDITVSPTRDGTTAVYTLPAASPFLFFRVAD